MDTTLLGHLVGAIQNGAKAAEKKGDMKAASQMLEMMRDTVDGKPIQGVELSAKRQTVFKLTGDGQVAALMPGEETPAKPEASEGSSSEGPEEVEFNPDDV